LSDLQQFENAVAAFRGALRLKPDFIEALNNLGHAFFDMGALDAAITTFNQALNIRLDNLTTLPASASVPIGWISPWPQSNAY